MTRRALTLAGLASLAATALLVALDSADALRRGARALVLTSGSNIGDPWPTIVAAKRLSDGFHAPLYVDFSLAGSSFIYPPLAALPFTPFAHLDYEGAHAALSIVSRVAFVACLVLAWLLARVRERPLVALAFVAFCAIGFYPLLRAVELNQATMLVAVLLGGSMLAALRGREALAGALVAAAAAFKPQLALIVPMLFWRSRRFTVAGVLTLVGLGVASLIYAGLDNHVRYVTTVLPQLSGGYSFFPNQSWSATFLRCAGYPAMDFAIVEPSRGLRALSLVATLATLGGGVIALRRPADGREGLALSVAFAWLIVTLASPISWEHHYAPALFVFALLLRRATRDELPGGALILAAAAFPWVASFIDVRHFEGGLGRLAMSYVLAGGLLLAAALTRATAAQSPAAPRD